MREILFQHRRCHQPDRVKIKYAIESGCPVHSWIKWICEKIAAREPTVSNTTAVEVKARLNGAKNAVERTTYTAIPRAVSNTSEGVVLFGASRFVATRSRRRARGKRGYAFCRDARNARAVRKLGPMDEAFFPTRRLCRAQDVEGAEQRIVPQMIRQNAGWSTSFCGSVTTMPIATFPISQSAIN